MIRINHDPEADVLHVGFGPENAGYDGSQEVAPGVFVEFDTTGAPIAIEVVSVSRRATKAPGSARLAAD